MSHKDISKISTTTNHINLDGSLKKKRVAIYARVSTKKELQMSSFELQISTYQTLINSNPLWELAGVFADYGKSGTSVVKRIEFLKMLELAKLGEIDIIITKSISRFTRDIVTGLKAIQEFRDLGVEIRFEKENISTSDTSFDFFLTIFASVAEEESKMNSSNVLWTYKKKMNNGDSTTSRLYGFTFDKDGNFIINNAQAPAVRLIFDLYIEGKTLNEIIEIVYQHGYKTFNNKPRFTIGALNRILRNEKYCGDMMLQKTVIKSMGNRASVDNTTKPKYYVSENHQGIISKVTFNKVQDIIKERAKRYAKNPKTTPALNYTNYVYSIIANKFYKSKINHRGTRHEIKLLEVLDQNRNRLLDAKNIYYRQIDITLAAAFNELLKSAKVLKNEIQQELEYKIKITNIETNIKSLTEKMDSLTTNLNGVDKLLIDPNAKQQLKSNLKSDIADIKNQLLLLKHQKLMRYSYEKNIPIFMRRINKLNNKDVDLKDIFNYIIAIDRDDLILCIHLSNRNIADINLNDEINNKPLKSGTFKFIQTRLNIDVKWRIIII